ncbi:domain K- type Rna binding proteins family protein [Cardiosporidium cionae]|uniref:Domain K- type Rna binding proteins family protein n=1 Tax=Cardiosporidium cionae TaxID=476202 RepID=A0ABQ7JEE6_9APIC|nr:domain K- type Rna binding proteins family protein [Cardiosporidium cionae]|eukprot:KAF8822025.1 domain K- type Rna binding proteins family protein [Cardiosporidium cionae]
MDSVAMNKVGAPITTEDEKVRFPLRQPELDIIPLRTSNQTSPFYDEDPSVDIYPDPEDEVIEVEPPVESLPEHSNAKGSISKHDAFSARMASSSSPPKFEDEVEYSDASPVATEDEREEEDAGLLSAVEVPLDDHSHTGNSDEAMPYSINALDNTLSFFSDAPGAAIEHYTAASSPKREDVSFHGKNEGSRNSMPRPRVLKNEDIFANCKNAITEYTLDGKQITCALQRNVLGVLIDDVYSIALTNEDAAFVLGKAGNTKRKISKVSGCHIELNDEGLRLDITGTEEQREKAILYIKLILKQRIGPDQRNDLTLLEIPHSAVGYVTGAHGCVLRRVEDEWGTLMFFVGGPQKDFMKKTNFVENSSHQMEEISLLEKLLIFGTMRSRRGAELKIMSAVEQKCPGFFTSSIETEVENKEEGFATDIVFISSDDFSYSLGKEGRTRKKLARASGCILEYVGRIAFISGILEERQRVRDYLNWLIQQRTITVDVDISGRTDVSTVDIRLDCVAYVTGKQGQGLRDTEDRTGTFCFFDGERNDERRSVERLLIFGAEEVDRFSARRLILDMVEQKLRKSQRIYPLILFIFFYLLLFYCVGWFFLIFYIVSSLPSSSLSSFLFSSPPPPSPLLLPPLLSSSPLSSPPLSPSPPTSPLLLPLLSFSPYLSFFIFLLPFYRFHRRSYSRWPPLLPNRARRLLPKTAMDRLRRRRGPPLSTFNNVLSSHRNRFSLSTKGGLHPPPLYRQKYPRRETLRKDPHRPLQRPLVSLEDISAPSHKRLTSPFGSNRPLVGETEIPTEREGKPLPSSYKSRHHRLLKEASRQRSLSPPPFNYRHPLPVRESSHRLSRAIPSSLDASTGGGGPSWSTPLRSGQSASLARRKEERRRDPPTRKDSSLLPLSIPWQRPRQGRPFGHAKRGGEATAFSEHSTSLLTASRTLRDPPVEGTFQRPREFRKPHAWLSQRPVETSYYEERGTSPPSSFERAQKRRQIAPFSQKKESLLPLGGTKSSRWPLSTEPSKPMYYTRRNRSHSPPELPLPSTAGCPLEDPHAGGTHASHAPPRALPTASNPSYGVSTRPQPSTSTRAPPGYALLPSSTQPLLLRREEMPPLSPFPKQRKREALRRPTRGEDLSLYEGGGRRERLPPHSRRRSPRMHRLPPQDSRLSLREERRERPLPPRGASSSPNISSTRNALPPLDRSPSLRRAERHATNMRTIYWEGESTTQALKPKWKPFGGPSTYPEVPPSVEEAFRITGIGEGATLLDRDARRQEIHRSGNRFIGYKGYAEKKERRSPRGKGDGGGGGGTCRESLHSFWVFLSDTLLQICVSSFSF